MFQKLLNMFKKLSKMAMDMLLILVFFLIIFFSFLPLPSTFIYQLPHPFPFSGSVYFDTHKFNDSPSHTYCKLDPSKFANSEANLKLLAEGEGALSTAAPSEKKNPQVK